MNVDQKCVELAEHFLNDFPIKLGAGSQVMLAEVIQQAVEDWLDYATEGIDTAKERGA